MKFSGSRVAAEHIISILKVILSSRIRCSLSRPADSFPIIKESLSGYVLLFTDDFLSLNRLDHNFLRGFDFFHRVDHPPALHLPPEQSIHFDNFAATCFAEYQSENFWKVCCASIPLQQFLIQAQRLYHAKVTSAGSARAMRWFNSSSA